MRRGHAVQTVNIFVRAAADRIPGRRAAYLSCPGRELDPSPCHCPCYGCKHHCAAHDVGAGS